MKFSFLDIEPGCVFEGIHKQQREVISIDGEQVRYKNLETKEIKIVGIYVFAGWSRFEVTA